MKSLTSSSRGKSFIISGIMKSTVLSANMSVNIVVTSAEKVK